MSYAALYKGTTPIINLAAGSGGGGPWVRPAWPALADLTSTNNVFTAIYGVDSTDSNFVSLLVATDSGTYTVDWGDGTTDTGIASNVQVNHTYDYATITASVVGNYKPVVVTVTTSGGNITTFDLGKDNPLGNTIAAESVNWLDIAINASAMTSLIISASLIGSLTVRQNSLEKITIYNNSITNMSYIFSGLVSLQSIAFLMNTTLVNNMTSMFSSCRSLKIVPLIDTSAVTNMSGMFSQCSSLQAVPLFNTGLVNDMSSMFQNCTILQSVPLFNTASVTNMLGMFNGCAFLQSVPLFNTAAVTNMANMFDGCTSLQSVPLFNTAAVTSMSSMFNNCIILKSVPSFNTVAVTNMASMFAGCASLKIVPLFNTSLVNGNAFGGGMQNMFNSCYSLQKIPLFITSAIISSARIGSMFSNCPSLCEGRTNGIRFSISYANCKLSTAALNDIFTGLGTASGTQTITITYNPGAATCTRSIATAKGWTVTG